jgi:hypothetical protein
VKNASRIFHDSYGGRVDRGLEGEDGRAVGFAQVGDVEPGVVVEGLEALVSEELLDVVKVGLDHLGGVNNGCCHYFPDQVCQLQHNYLSLHYLPRTSPFRLQRLPIARRKEKGQGG